MISQIQPVFIILYVPVFDLITQNLVNKLCNCKSAYLGRVDGVRDEMRNHWLGNVGSTLRLTVGSIRYLLQKNVRRRIMLVITIIKTVFCDSHFTIITAYC